MRIQLILAFSKVLSQLKAVRLNDIRMGFNPFLEEFAIRVQNDSQAIFMGSFCQRPVNRMGNPRSGIAAEHQNAFSCGKQIHQSVQILLGAVKTGFIEFGQVHLGIQNLQIGSGIAIDPDKGMSNTQFFHALPDIITRRASDQSRCRAVLAGSLQGFGYIDSLAPRILSDVFQTVQTARDQLIHLGCLINGGVEGHRGDHAASPVMI